MILTNNRGHVKLINGNHWLEGKYQKRSTDLEWLTSTNTKTLQKPLKFFLLSLELKASRDSETCL